MSLEIRPYTPPHKSELPGFSVEELRISGNRANCGGVEKTFDAVGKVMKAVPVDMVVWTNNPPVNFPRAFAQYGERLRVTRKDNKGFADLSEVPDGSVFIISAHGAPPPTFQLASEKGLLLVDTTCPYVTTEQKKVRQAEQDEVHSVFIGEKNHPETIGVKGQVAEDHITIFDPKKGLEGVSIPDNSRVFAKTTNDPEETQAALEQIVERNPTVDISGAHSCYALNNRFLSGKIAIRQADFWLVVGDESSHNARGLRKIGLNRSIPAALVTGPEEIDWSWFNPGIKLVSVTGAASVPERYIQDTIDPFRSLGVRIVDLPQAVKEDYRIFKVPVAQIDLVRQQFSQ